MAPSFKHGRCTKVLLNAVDLSVILNDSELARSVDTAEATPYATSTGGCTTDKSYVVGHRDATANFSGMADASTSRADAIIENALGSSTRQAWTWGPGGASVGDPAYLGRAHTSAFNVTSPARDVVAVSADVQFGVSGTTGGVNAPGVKSGYWLMSPTALRTTTGALATVTNHRRSTASAGPARGAVAHVHVVSATTSTGTVKIQHSTDGVSWADLVTHPFSSGASYARYAGSTAVVKELLRANVTAISPAGARIGIAFAPHV